MPLIHQLSFILHDTIPSAILLNFFLLIGLICFNWKTIKEFILKIDRKTWYALAFIFAVAIMLRIFIPAHQHIMYIDEQWYMEAGKNMLQTGSQEFYPKSIAWPFILRIAFGIFDISNWTAIYTSILLGSLTCFTIFFMAFAVTKSKYIGLLSALFIAFSPAHIRWSATAETNIASLFFITLAVFFCYLYYIKRKYSLLWLALVALAFTVQFRPENYVFPILFLIGCIIYEKRFIQNHLSHIDIKFILPWLVLIFLSFANLAQVVDYQASTDWIESDTKGEQTGSNWSFDNLAHNSLHYGIYIFNSEFQPALFSVFLLIGIFYAGFNQKKEFLFLIAWLGLLWFIYFFSWFQTLGGSSAILSKTRFFMMFYPITAIFAGYGILGIKDLVSSKIAIGNGKMINRHQNEKMKKYLDKIINRLFLIKSILPLAAILLILMLIPYSISASSWRADPAHRLETRIPELAEKDIPQGCVIIANLPTILRSTTDLSVVEMDYFLADQKTQENIFNKSKCVLFFEDYYCLDTSRDRFREKCDEIKDKFLLKDYISYSEEEKTYSFFRISNKTISNKTKIIEGINPSAASVGIS